MKLLFISALAAVLLASPTVHATPLDDRIAELKHAVEKEAAAHANGGNNPQFGNAAMNPAFIDASIDQIVAQMENPAYGNMDAQLAQITSMYSSTEVQEATTNLLAEFKKERKEKIDAEIASVKALLTRAGTAITQAKKPEDLDDLIAEMGKHGNYGGNSALQSDQELQRRFSGAYEFVKQWQNYLAHMASGQSEQARNDLQSLSNNTGGEGLLPRSKLLELEAPDKMTTPGVKPAPVLSGPVAQAQVILESIKTLDDVSPALAKLEPLRQGDGQELQTLYNQLSNVAMNYEEMKAGLPAGTNINFDYNPGPLSVPPALRAQLLIFELQNAFSSFKGAPPAPQEKPIDYVDRVIADALARQDWDLLKSAESARGTLTRSSTLGYTATYAGGLDNFIAGTHQEAAGQFSLAVRSYEQALQSSDPSVPVKVIGERLAAIQRDHAKEFADGMQLIVNPPAPRYVQGRAPGMPYQSYPNPYQLPGMPLTPTAAPVVAMPATPATNAPTPVAPPSK